MEQIQPDTLQFENRTMVLLVDDQAFVAHAVRRLLAGLPDVDFHYCSDPMEAIEQANRIKPSVILQDLVMPSVDGLDLVKLYRSNPGTAETPILVLSSEENPVVKSQAFAAGANDYLVKLPDRIELIARIRYHSKAHIHRLQRDEAFRALRESQRQLMEANIELQRLTSIDALTGLMNRRFFDSCIHEEWEKAAAVQSPLSVLLIDVDDFKQYNDIHGHLVGDDVLRKVAEALRAKSSRKADCVARFGGEEFGVILPATSVEGAQTLGEVYCQGVEELKFARNGTGARGYLTVSVGGASTIPKRGESFMDLISAADRVLYQAKKAGKNRVITCAMA
ncbi:MAG TPA: diguanylate cyclase [Bryobacteraceae bacterium]|nr:diguanylate cyclase [Bryobacteraceae bacterium]